MKIIYQDRELETASSTLTQFLMEHKLAGNTLILEYNEEILNSSPGNLPERPLAAGDRINVFSVVAGG
ncbi:MAG: MoaD/ThiS family protein [Victivallaceae bacterium]|nr:MoaD/ThiS family protein [Victivallaceae bacterium]